MIKSHDSVSEIIIENSCNGVGVGETFNVKRMNDLNKYFFIFLWQILPNYPSYKYRTIQPNIISYHNILIYILNEWMNKTKTLMASKIKYYV